MIMAECRDPELDSRLRTTWDILKANGTRYFEGAVLRRRITDFQLKPKRANVAGLQIADLVVTPIGRHVSGRTDREDFTIIEGKFRRNANGEYVGWGLVVLPKTR